MILPIVAYGSPILRKVASAINKDYPELDTLLEDMWETMYKSNGVGLAAPQINKSIRLFIIDTTPMVTPDPEDDEPIHTDEVPVKKVFINAKMLSETGEAWAYNEGCLSIPKVRADVMRMPDIQIQYQDEHFVEHIETFSGMAARVIQHEYDHIEGKLFIDHIKPLKRKMLSRKLDDIMKGKVSMGYKLVHVK